MSRIDDHRFIGKSGREHAFAVHARRAVLPARPALYLLGYRHPRGHLAGFHVVPLWLGMAENLAARLAAHPSEECLRSELWNCVCVLEAGPDTTSPAPREAFDDLLPALAPACGHDAT
jgi:hypothetical protein